MKVIYCEYLWLWLEMISFWHKRNLECFLWQVWSVRLNILDFIQNESQVQLNLSFVFPQWEWIAVTWRLMLRKRLPYSVHLRLFSLFSYGYFQPTTFIWIWVSETFSQCFQSNQLPAGVTELAFIEWILYKILDYWALY